MRSRPASNSRFVLYAALVLCAGLLVPYVLQLSKTFPIDFVAFWCAGQATLAHQNPYLEGSLHGCQTAHGLIATLTVPVPYPPYVMPLFAAIALVPEPAAFAVWCVLLVAATALTAVAIGRLAALPPALTFGACAALLAVPALPYGQIAPFAICCFAWALVAVRENRPIAAAAALAGAAILPSFAIAAWIAAFVCAPRVRVPLLIAALLLVAIGVLATGANVAWLYLGPVLAAHGRSEMLGYWQVGWTGVIRGLGASQSVTLAIAYAIFAAMIVLGIFAGVRLRARYGGDHWIVASATAFGVIGGPFVHGHDLGFALPLALMLFSVMPEMLTVAAIVLLVTPWQLLVDSGGFQAAMAYPFLLLVVDAVTRARPIVTAAILVAIALASVALLKVSAGNQTPIAAASKLTSLPAPPNDALAETRWTALNDTLGTGRYAWYERAPIYAGFLLLAVATFHYRNNRTRAGKSV